MLQALIAMLIAAGLWIATVTITTTTTGTQTTTTETRSDPPPKTCPPFCS